MNRKLKKTTNSIWSFAAIAMILVLWQCVCMLEMVGSFMLPSPVQVLEAFIAEFPVLVEHSAITLAEAFLGLLMGILLGFVMAVIMDQFEPVYKAFYPLIILTQVMMCVFQPMLCR